MNADRSWLVTRRWAAVGFGLCLGFVPLLLLEALLAVYMFPLFAANVGIAVPGYVLVTWRISDRLAVDDGDR